MKKLLLIVLSIVGFVNFTKADTIDFWSIYLNETKLQNCNGFAIGKVVLKINDIKRTDSLTVNYFTCAACFDCETRVSVENSQGKVIASGKGLGTYNPIKISLFDMVQNSGKMIYIAYFYRGLDKDSANKQELFTLQFE